MALGLADAKRWDQLMSELPLYLDGSGLAAYFPLAEGAPDRGSDILSGYLLAAAHEAGVAIPEAQRARLLDGLSAFVEGRIKRDLPLGRQDADARRLSAMEALARYGRFRPAMLDVLDLNPQKMSTAMLVDWLALLNRAADIPQRAARLSEAENLLRARLTYQGTRMGFSTEASDNAWWLMGSADVNAAKLLLTVRKLPGWQADMPRLLTGLLGRQQKAIGAPPPPIWGSLAVAQFSRQFETTPVSGQTSAALGGAKLNLGWPQEGIKQLGLLPWLAAAACNSSTPAAARRGPPSRPKPPSRSSAALRRLQHQENAEPGQPENQRPVPARRRGQGHTGNPGAKRYDLGSGQRPDPRRRHHPFRPGPGFRDQRQGRQRRRPRRLRGAPLLRLPRLLRRARAAAPESRYTMRLNNPGAFKLPPTRVEALRAGRVRHVAQPGIQDSRWQIERDNLAGGAGFQRRRRRWPSPAFSRSRRNGGRPTWWYWIATASRCSGCEWTSKAGGWTGWALPRPPFATRWWCRKTGVSISTAAWTYGVAAAAWGNLWNTRTRGASTLTMQLAGLLDNDLKVGRNGRSLWQKMGQGLVAAWLETHWSKAQILEAYLNLVGFRGELVGLSALSATLFGKPPAGLNLEESAIAVALIRAPNATPDKVAVRACRICRTCAASPLRGAGGAHPPGAGAEPRRQSAGGAGRPHFAQSCCSASR